MPLQTYRQYIAPPPNPINTLLSFRGQDIQKGLGEQRNQLLSDRLDFDKRQLTQEQQAALTEVVHKFLPQLVDLDPETYAKIAPTVFMAATATIDGLGFDDEVTNEWKTKLAVMTDQVRADPSALPGQMAYINALGKALAGPEAGDFKTGGGDKPMSPIGKLLFDYNTLKKSDPNSPDLQYLKMALDAAVADKGMIIRTNPDGTMEMVTGSKKLPPRNLPAEAAGKLGEYKAYIDTISGIQDQLKVADEAGQKIKTGPGEIYRKKMDDWDLWADDERIALRSDLAQLYGLLYAMRGKQLSDKEIEVAEKFFPRMNLAPKTLRIYLDRFQDWAAKTFKEKQKAYKGAGYVFSFDDLEPDQEAIDRYLQESIKPLSEAEKAETLKLLGF